jgi:hypothetical protein
MSAENDASIVHADREKLTLLAALGFVMAGMGVALVRYFPRDAALSFCGWLLLAGSAPAALLPLRRCLAGRRLRVAADRIEVVERAARVVGRIPFDNVASVETWTRGEQSAVVITVRDPARGDTWWPGGALLRRVSRGLFDYDFCIEPSYELRGAAISHMIVARLERHRGGGTAPSETG